MKTSRNTKTASLVALAALTLGGLTAVPSAAQAAEPTSIVQTIDSETNASWRIKAVRGATNIRSGPSTGHSIVGSLSTNQQVTVKWIEGSKGDSWWVLSGGRGYVSNVMLKPTGSTTPPKSGKSVTRYVSASTAANIRSGPSTGYSVVGSAKRGAKVTGTVSGGWLRLGHKRYVSGSVLSASPINQTAPPKAGKSVTRYVDTSGYASMRSAPNGDLVKRVIRGDRVRGTISGGWMKTPQGYISTSVLSTTQPSLTVTSAGLLGVRRVHPTAYVTWNKASDIPCKGVVVGCGVGGSSPRVWLWSGYDKWTPQYAYNVAAHEGAHTQRASSEGVADCVAELAMKERGWGKYVYSYYFDLRGYGCTAAEKAEAREILSR